MTIYVLTRRWAEPVETYNGLITLKEDDFLRSSFEIVSVATKKADIDIAFQNAFAATRGAFSSKYGNGGFACEYDQYKNKAVFIYPRDIEVIEMEAFFVPVKVSL